MKARFPWLRHGVGSSDDLRLWIVLAGSTASTAGLTQRFDAWAKGFRLTTTHRVDGPLAFLRAKGLKRLSATVLRNAHAKLDAALLAVNTATPLALVVRENRVEASEWHARTMADAGAVLTALEQLVCQPGEYARPGAKVPVTNQEDLRALLLKTTRGNLQAELVEATLDVLRKSAATAAGGAVLHDVLLERIPAMLGFDFDTDVVLREALAVVSGLSATSIEMTPRFAAEVERRTIAAHRDTDTRLKWSAGGEKVDWMTAATVSEGITNGAWRALEAGFDDTDAGHAKTLLALTPEERSALAKHRQFGTLIANVAVHRMTRSDFHAALALYDAAVEGELHPGAAANPLYAVQDDNNHLGINAARARRYLERCLPHAPQNPTIFLNASFVFMELSEHDEAIRVLSLAKKHGIAVKSHRNERLFTPIRKRADFVKLMR